MEPTKIFISIHQSFSSADNYASATKQNIDSSLDGPQVYKEPGMPVSTIHCFENNR